MIKNYRVKWLNGRPQILPHSNPCFTLYCNSNGAPGRDNMYRMRMPFKQIDTVLKWAKPIDALCFRYPVAHSTVKTEVTELVKYLPCPKFI
jgi:hypothetical protein